MRVFEGKIGEGMTQYWTPMNLFLLLELFSFMPVLVKIDQEMRPWECTQTVRYTGANWFYNLSHAICYSYGADNNERTNNKIFKLEIRSMERGICPIAPLTLRLTLYSLTGSRVWPLESRDVIGHVTIGTTHGHFLLVVCWRQVTISRTVAKILSIKHFGVTTLTLSCHVTSLVTWPLEPQLVVSYWSSVDTMSLSCTVAETLSVKNNWVT